MTIPDSHTGTRGRSWATLGCCVIASSFFQAGCADNVDVPCPGAPLGVSGCEVSTLASAVVAPVGIAVDDDFIYLTTAPGAVLKLSKRGGVPIVLASGPSDPVGISTGQSSVYWVSGEAVLKAAKDFSGTTTLADNSDSLGIHLANDAEDIYWPAKTSVKRVSSSGGPTSTLVASDNAFGIAVDDSNVYWSERSTGAIMSVPKAGGDAVVLVPPGLHVAFDLTIDATHAYWGTEEAIVKVAKTGGAVTKIADARRALSIAVDAEHVFWSDAVDNDLLTPTTMIRRAPITGGSSATLAAGQQSIGLIAVDSTSVYWTDIGAGTVMSVAK